MAAEAQRAPQVREQRIAPGALRRFLNAIEPWYDWGTTNTFRLDAQSPTFEDEAEGDVRFFTLQWFRLHLEIQVGRTPKAVRS
jgi:hypothetical protein